DQALDCWLSNHPNVVDNMNYSDSSVTYVPWPDWPASVKTELRVFFTQMVLWYHAGMPPDYPKLFEVVIDVSPGGWPHGPWLSEAKGRRVYLALLANALAAELTHAFGWSITTYTPIDLYHLLGM